MFGKDILPTFMIRNAFCRYKIARRHWRVMARFVRLGDSKRPHRLMRRMAGTTVDDSNYHLCVLDLWQSVRQNVLDGFRWTPEGQIILHLIA
jgi:hypothetical protein